MAKIFILIFVLIVGCSQADSQENKPQPAYSGGCGIGDYFVVPESAWRLIEAKEEYLEIEYLCCKNTVKRL